MKVVIVAPRAKNCGISQYSTTLYQHLLKTIPSTKGQVQFSRISLTIGPLINVVGIVLSMLSNHYKVLHFQYHPGLLTFDIPIIGQWLFRANLIALYSLLILRSFLSRLRSVGKTCITVHGTSTQIHPILRKWLSKFDYIIVHSEIMRKTLITGGIPSAKIRVIPHGVPKFSEESKGHGKDKNKNEVKIILFGYIHKNKGHHVAIEALQFLPMHYKLLICGKPRLRSHIPYFYKLREIALTLGVQHRVEFLGYIPNHKLEEVLSEGDCSIFPYLWTSNWLEWSGALSIAIACGLPIVASDVPLFRELYDRYSCVVLSRPGDPQSLASAIQQLVEDQQLGEKLRRSARVFQEEASWEKVADLTLNTYLELLVDHPDWIYANESQRARISWLRSQCKGKVLEVGCATGYVAGYVGSATGVDIRLDRLILAQRKYPQVQFLLCDATRLPFPDRSYDTVLLPEILEHLPFEQAVKALEEAVRVSREVVLVTLPRAEHPSYMQDAATGHLNPEHLWDPTEIGLKDLFSGYSYELAASPCGKFWFVKVFSK